VEVSQGRAKGGPEESQESTEEPGNDQKRGRREAEESQRQKRGSRRAEERQKRSKKALKGSFVSKR
jgi:hypothetical protein